mmetsp:Transcript_25594/g.48086  ORF Transcript_25594/g.48086 Transcript_25594/m.48086 type:complete len:201 (-) Transcript_25594:790-1392(-)
MQVTCPLRCLQVHFALLERGRLQPTVIVAIDLCRLHEPEAQNYLVAVDVTVLELPVAGVHYLKVQVIVLENSNVTREFQSIAPPARNRNELRLGVLATKAVGVFLHWISVPPLRVLVDVHDGIALIEYCDSGAIHALRYHSDWTVQHFAATNYSIWYIHGKRQQVHLVAKQNIVELFVAHDCVTPAFDLRILLILPRILY